jgi:hypothetical protein
MLAAGPIAPAWAILPVGILALIVVGLHVSRMLRSDMPPSRRRIRIANGVLMMFTIPLFAFALSLVDPASQQKLFAMTWMLNFCLMTLIFGVACFDILNNIRIYRVERAQLRREIARPRPTLKLTDPASSESDSRLR